jgi:mannitol-1-phosphate/altronate dehydrogenase
MNSGQGGVADANVILHIGAGSFHRAHQAWYLHRLNEIRQPGEPSWSLTVGNIRADMKPVLEGLAAQDGVYTLETVTPAGERAYETIRSIERVVPWTESLDGLIEAGANPDCKIVAFTVTEGGYYLDSTPPTPTWPLTSAAATSPFTAHWRPSSKPACKPRAAPSHCKAATTCAATASAFTRA